MKSSPRFPIRILFFSLGPALLAFLAGFGIAYQQDLSRATELARLAWLHLAYAQELKDDMAVIDWSKNLEKLESVRAFEVTADSKTIVQGGNTKDLPSTVGEGMAYLFPSDWSYRETSAKGVPGPFEFTVLFHYWPGPALWGCFFFLVSFAGGCCFAFLFGRTSATTVKAGRDPGEAGESSLSASTSAKPAAKPAGIPLGKDAAHLFIDQNYVIRQVTSEAAQFLRRKVAELQDRHLLDLTPDPALIQAFETRGETRIPKPFSDCPDVDVRLKPDAEGCFLILERSSGLKPL